jgi:hypothetical protein
LIADTTRDKLADYDAFMKAVQERFGGYKKSEYGLVMAYLQKDIDERRLPTLWRYLIYVRKPEYGPPSVPHLEEAIRLGRENHNEGSVYKVQHYNTMQVDRVSPEEFEEGRALLDAHGGLVAWLRAKRSGNA